MPTSPLYAEDFAFFYDGIHGRASFRDLPDAFIRPLRVVLNSKYLNRLTRISQLGYTSLTYFSATQTRFSHAVGTLLMMNRLSSHLWGEHRNSTIPPEIVEAVKVEFPNATKVGALDQISTKTSDQISIRCHLLLAALFQDVGELPFQKITSQYLRPQSTILSTLDTREPLKRANPSTWKNKDVFTIAALVDLVSKEPALYDFDLAFLAYLVTGQPELTNVHLMGLRQMLDGVVDADRLDYVYRDAYLTIGGLTDAEAVVQSIRRYEGAKVVVSDPRPVTDFLATRARLWSFVYSSPAVRFRHALLRSFLQAAFVSEEGTKLLGMHGLPRELTLAGFVELDDHSMLRAIRAMDEDHDKRLMLGEIEEFGRNAREILIKPVSDYECRIFTRPKQDPIDVPPASAPTPGAKLLSIPPDVFFDLQADTGEEHRLYAPGTVLVDQALTEKMKGQPLALEQCSGALSSLLRSDTSVPLVPQSFLLFLPEKHQRNQASLENIEKAMSENSPELYHSVDIADIQRELTVPNDTWDSAKATGKKKIAISCCFKDRTAVVRIIRELHRLGQPYRVLLDSLLWLGNTSQHNSERLIEEADAVFIILSKNYVEAWSAGGNIAAEVREIYKKSGDRKVVLPLRTYDELKGPLSGKWVAFDKNWDKAPILVPVPVQGSVDALRKVLSAACTTVNGR